MQNTTEAAVSRFKEGFSCSQAILSTFGEQFGLDRDTALKLAAGFGGGMGRMAGNMRCRYRGHYGLGIEIRSHFTRRSAS